MMELTKVEYNELMELLEDQRYKKFLLQKINDTLENFGLYPDGSGIRSANITEYRNTMVFNDWGNCDSTYPFIMDFELLENMTKLVECKVSFKIRNFNIGVKDI